MSKSERAKLFQHPAFLLLEKATNREWQLELFATLGLLLLGLGVIYFAFDKYAILTFIGIVLTIMGTNLSIKKARSIDKTDNRLIYLLKEEPGKIVWVYAVLTQRMPFGVEWSQNGILYFKLIDGDEISVSIPANQLKMVSKTLSRVIPHASFGYTEIREETFNIDPALLKKKEGNNQEEGNNEK